VDDLWSWILQESSPVFDRFSSLIFQTTGEDENGWVSLARHRELLAPATAYLSFPASEFNLKEYTHLVVGDLTTRPGLTQALEAVLRLAEEGNVRACRVWCVGVCRVVSCGPHWRTTCRKRCGWDSSTTRSRIRSRCPRSAGRTSSSLLAPCRPPSLLV
jgi:hypothetical protein